MCLKLPVLPYAYNFLEPYIDQETMIIHHTKHHQTYINNVNKILQEKIKLNEIPIFNIIKVLNNISIDNNKSLRDNIGGYINHTLFWQYLKPGVSLQGDLKIAIENNFNSIKSFQKLFETLAVNHFGSGWIWLIKKDNKLKIISTQNQDNPLMERESSNKFGYPILGIDLWEHAYYLKYQNRKIEYLQAIWNIINWDTVSFYYQK